VPNGDNGNRLFELEPELAATVIKAHIAKQRTILEAASIEARTWHGGGKY
jgi:hypothetical protein